MISDVKQYTCARCGSLNVRKNGHSVEGRSRYHCKDCQFYGTTSEVAQQRIDRYQ